MTTCDPATPPAEPARQDLIDALVQASFAAMAVLNRVGAEHDLSLTQVRVLAILRDRRLQMSELASYLGLDRSTISGLVDRAERRGLLERTASPHDGRGVHVALAPAGVELAERGAAEVAASLAPSTGDLTAAEKARLTTLLERLLSSAPA